MIDNGPTAVSGSHSFFSLSFLLLGICIILFTGTVVTATTLWVQPSSEVAIRRGQGTDYKIIAMAKDGISVQLLEENENYSRVRLPNNKEGWMLKRFLSRNPPLKEVVDSLRLEKENFIQKEIESSEEIADVTTTLSQTQLELQSVITERDQIRDAYLNLQNTTADTVQIQKNQQKTAKENKELLQQLNSIQTKNKSLEKDSSIKWFLAGCGVLLLGMIIGAMSNRSRKRSSSFY